MALINSPAANQNHNIYGFPPNSYYMQTKGNQACQTVGGHFQLATVELKLFSGTLTDFPPLSQFLPATATVQNQGITYNPGQHDSQWCTNMLGPVSAGSKTLCARATFQGGGGYQTFMTAFTAVVAAGYPPPTCPAHYIHLADPDAEQEAEGAQQEAAVEDEIECPRLPFTDEFADIALSSTPSSIRELCFRVGRPRYVEIKIFARIGLMPDFNQLRQPCCEEAGGITIRTGVSISGTSFGKSYRDVCLSEVGDVRTVDLWYALPLGTGQYSLSWDLVDLVGSGNGASVHILDGIILAVGHRIPGF